MEAAASGHEIIVQNLLNHASVTLLWNVIYFKWKIIIIYNNFGCASIWQRKLNASITKIDNQDLFPEVKFVFSMSCLSNYSLHSFKNIEKKNQIKLWLNQLWLNFFFHDDSQQFNYESVLNDVRAYIYTPNINIINAHMFSVFLILCMIQGVRTEERNNKGETARALAMLYGHTKIASLIDMHVMRAKSCQSHTSAFVIFLFYHTCRE